MKKRTKIFIYCAAFAVAFLVSAVVRIAMLGSAPERLIQVEWNDSVGTVYKDLPYENDSGHGYDLYIPAGLRSTEDQHLILFIHGGSFNSGAKEDGDAWCKFYASKGYGKVLWEVPKKMAHQPPKIQTVLIKNKAWTSQRK